jgi:hypothetical protein
VSAASEVQFQSVIEASPKAPLMDYTNLPLCVMNYYLSGPLLARGHQAVRDQVFDLLPTVLYMLHVHRSTDPHRSPTVCYLLSSPHLPCPPRNHCQNHWAPRSSNSPGPRDSPNGLGHPSETGPDPPKRVGSPPNPVLPAILSQSYPAFPPRPRLRPKLASILSFRTFAKQ